MRENLNLRLLNARLALLAHEQSVFRTELKQAQLWVDRYFDAGDKSVQAARESLKQLSSTEISVAMPNLNESLSAIKNLKRGADIPIAVLVPRVQLKKRLNVERLVAGRVPRLAAAIEKQLRRVD